VIEHLMRKWRFALRFDLPGKREHGHAVEPGVRHRVDQIG